MDFFSGLKPKPDDLKLVIALIVAYYGLKMEIQENISCGLLAEIICEVKHGI